MVLHSKILHQSPLYELKYIKGVDVVEEMNVALRIATLRTKKGVSAREMSLDMGQNANYINQIENSGSAPSIQGLFYICEYLGITPSEFFDVDNKNPEKLKAIIENLKKLSDSQLELIEKLTNEMIKK